jgi:hypothetical protein
MKAEMSESGVFPLLFVYFDCGGRGEAVLLVKGK